MKKFEGTAEELVAYEQGVADERERMNKILLKYHSTFGSGNVSESETMMQIKYIYEFINNVRTLK